jgi:hypothetical protein
MDDDWKKRWQKDFDITSREQPILKMILKKLTKYGGESISPQKNFDAMKIIQRGVMCQGDVKLMKMEACQCHENSLELHLSNPSRYDLYTGYGLSIDGMWREHSWVFDTKEKIIIETTMKRVLYFGFRMTDADINDW